jgi:tRNA(Arg) A34 adenosine deaminase TadA
MTLATLERKPEFRPWPKSEPRGSVPPRELLEEAAPIALWDAAIKQATRSTHSRHRTGAIIYDPVDSTVVGRGCSHNPDKSPWIETRSVHAERHALWSLPPDFPWTYGCIVVTLTRTNNFAQVSKPCASCASLLRSYDIDHCIYAERANDASWTVQRLPVHLLTNCKPPRTIL